MRILLSGGAGFSNAGDEALLLASIQICHKLFARAAFTVVSPNPEVTGKTLQGQRARTVTSARVCLFANDVHYKTADTVFFKRWNILHQALVGKTPELAIAFVKTSSLLDFVDRKAASLLLQAIAKTSALVIHGGGILTSATRSRLWEHSLMAELAASWGKPVLLRSHQFGPYDCVEDAERARLMVSKSQFVSTRDLDQGSRLLRELLPGVDIFDRVDDALRVILPQRDLSLVRCAYRLSPGKFIAVAYRDNKIVGMEDGGFQRMAEIVKVAQKLFALPVALVPQAPADAAGLRRLQALLPGDVHLIEPLDFFLDPMDIAAASRLMIAVPHHSLIFALRQGVPVISPVMGDYYRFKNIGSMRHFGLEEFVVDISGGTSGYLAESRRLLKRIKTGGLKLQTELVARRDALVARSEAADALFKLAFSSRALQFSPHV